MECWSTYPTVSLCMNGIHMDTRMMPIISSSPTWIWIGSLFVWILAILPYIVDARNIIKYKLEEEVSEGTIIGNVLKDSHLKKGLGSSIIKELYFTFLTDTDYAVTLEPSTGILRTSGRIDRESISNCQNKDFCEITLDVAVQPILYFQIFKINIEILDINDNAPVFHAGEITHPILESAETGSSFIIPTATDLDSPMYGVVRYELESHRNTFGVKLEKKLDGSRAVQLTIDRRLDRERRHRYKVKVVAYDGGEPAKEGRMNIIIPILDSNDNSPVFDQPVYDINIPENLSPGTSILQVLATDPDLGQNGKIQYNFSIQTENMYSHILAINPSTGEIFVKGGLDREQVSVCNLVVTARDQGPNALPAVATVVVTITDINDNIPQIRVSTLGSSRPNVANTPEDAVVGMFVAQVTVTDPDDGMNGMVNCTLNDYTFTLEQTLEMEYQIVTSRLLDRESIPQYGLEIVCTDKGHPPQVSVQRMIVVIKDVNDNAPEFTQKSYTSTMLENNYKGIIVLHTIATDMDSGANGEVRYSLSEDVRHVFAIDSQTGAISTKSRVDREVTQQFEFHVVATDRGRPAMSSFAPILINIEDVDDEVPNFVTSPFSFRISENEPVGSEVGKVTAVDLDVPPNNRFFYTFLNEELSEAFFLNSKTGQITSQEDLDRETQDMYRLVVKATDQKSPAMSSTAIVNIQVIDSNDNPPKLLFPIPKNNTVFISNKVPVGSVLAQIRAHDADAEENARLTYSVTGKIENFIHLDPNTGLLTSRKSFSDISYVSYSLMLQIVDNGRPPYRIQQEFKLVVNSSIPYPPPEPQAQVPKRSHNFHYNVIVVVAVACGATVMVVSFVICLILVRKNRRKRRNQCSGKPNGPTESHRMLSPKDTQNNGEDHIAMKDMGHTDISESMRKLLAANTVDWEKASGDIPVQGEVGLEITKVLSEMEDETTDLPELLSHTRSRGLCVVQDENGGVAGRSHGELLQVQDDQEAYEPEDRGECDSDATVEVNSITTAHTHTELDTANRSASSTKPSKGKVTFSEDSSLPRTKGYQYPPPPPPPPNRLRTFCPDGKLPESPQRSCLSPEKEASLQRRQPKVVTWQHGSRPDTHNGNHSNTLEPFNNDMDPWEQRQPTKTESMIV